MKKASPTWQWFQTLTWLKVWNMTKVVASYYNFRASRRPRMWGMPISMSVEPTTACNLGCPECPSGLKQFSRPTGNLHPNLFRTLLDQVKGHLSYLTFYFQGEPFIHPKFLDLVKMAVDAGIYTSTSTNAHFMSESLAEKTVKSGLHRMIISIDGTTQEVYEQYRVHGQLNKVLEGTRHLVAARNKHHSTTPHLIFQFLVVKPNEHQLDDVKKLAAELGVDEVWFKTAQLNDFENGHPLMPERVKYSRYVRKTDGTYRLKNRMDNRCWRMWSGCVVTWDGAVVPCCFDKDAKYAMGKIDQSPLSDIWRNQAYSQFRNKLAVSRKSIDICANCSEGTVVWADQDAV